MSLGNLASLNVLQGTYANAATALGATTQRYFTQNADDSKAKYVLKLAAESVSVALQFVPTLAMIHNYTQGLPALAQAACYSASLIAAGSMVEGKITLADTVVKVINVAVSALTVLAAYTMSAGIPLLALNAVFLVVNARALYKHAWIPEQPAAGGGASAAISPAGAQAARRAQDSSDDEAGTTGATPTIPLRPEDGSGGGRLQLGQELHPRGGVPQAADERRLAAEQAALAASAAALVGGDGEGAAAADVSAVTEPVSQTGTPQRQPYGGAGHGFPGSDQYGGSPPL